VSGSPLEGLLLAWCRRLTRYWILLNPTTPLPRPGPSRVIPHGHYRDWYPRTGVGPVPGRMLFFGLLRPYKGLEPLLEAFSGFDVPGASLEVVGRPTTPQLHALVERACGLDARVTALLEHADDATLADRIEQAQLVVLPYRELHNSGAMLAALSLDRPVLVPDGPTTRAIAAEVGPGWVITYHGELTPDRLRAALGATSARPDRRPLLGGRDWPTAALAHLDVYRRSVGWTGGATGRRPQGPRTR